MKTNKMSDEEREFEENIDMLRPVTGKKREKVEDILDRARKNRSISLRISSYDLGRLKEKAANQGIPYQTLINSVLHKYITNELFERDEVLKSLKLMGEVK